MHLEQAVAVDARDPARGYLVLVVLRRYVATDEEPDPLRAYAAAAGASYEEFANLEDVVPVAGTGEPHDGRRRRRATVG